MLGSGPRRGPGSGRWRDGPLRLVSGSKLWARRAPGGGARTARRAPGWSSARAAAPPGSPGARGPGCCCPCVRVLTSVFPWPQTGVADPQVRCCLPGLLPAAAQPGPPAPHAGVDEMPWGHGGHGGLVLPLQTRVLGPAVPPDPGQVPPQQAAGLMAGRPAGRSGGRGPELPRQGPNRRGPHVVPRGTSPLLVPAWVGWAPQAPAALGQRGAGVALAGGPGGRMQTSRLPWSSLGPSPWARAQGSADRRPTLSLSRGSSAPWPAACLARPPAPCGRTGVRPVPVQIPAL